MTYKDILPTRHYESYEVLQPAEILVHTAAPIRETTDPN